MRTLAYMASETSNKVMIVNYENGAIVKELVRLISDVSSPDNQVKNTATEIVGSLVCRATAAELVRSHQGILVTLASLSCGEGAIAVSSSKVIKKLSTHIHAADDCHGNLLQALVTMSYATQTEVLKWVVKAYAGEFNFFCAAVNQYLFMSNARLHPKIKLHLNMTGLA